MTTDKQELKRLFDAANLHEVYVDGYHALPRAVKRHLSLHDMQEIWHYMVRPTLEALTAAQQQVPDADEIYMRFRAWCQDNKQYDLDPRLHTHSGRSVSEGAYISDGVTRALFQAYRDGAISAAPPKEGK